MALRRVFSECGRVTKGQRKLVVMLRVVQIADLAALFWTARDARQGLTTCRPRRKRGLTDVLRRRSRFLLLSTRLAGSHMCKMYTPETSYEEFIKKEQEKYPELNLKDIEVLKGRVEANKDLPRIPDKLIVMFLHSSYFNVDTAYDTIVVNCKYRKELPQVFANYDPSSEEMKKVFETITICVLTDSCTGKEERILYTNFKNTDPQKYDYVQSVRYFFMVMEYLMVTHGTFDGVIVTMNSKGINWRHITKTPMGMLKKLLGFVQEALPVRLKEVHVLNSGSIVTALYNIVKPFMRSSLIEMLKLYPENSTDAVFKHLPIDIMPAEIGGNGKSHYEYSERTFDGMLSARDWFLSLD